MTEKQVTPLPFEPNTSEEDVFPSGPAEADDEDEALEEDDLDRVSGGARMPFSFASKQFAQAVLPNL